MLVDVLVSKMTTNEKILWFLVVFFLHLLGAAIYFFSSLAAPGRTSAVGTA